jgi:2-polyprenyl-6-methoxyphenol hydroxylase-like FAD-dependent oxidoreductase
MAEIMSRQVGDTRIAMRRHVFPRPVPDPGYDMPVVAFIVEVRHDDDSWGEEFTYADHDTALSVFNREIGYAAVLVAKRAMRRAA